MTEIPSDTLNLVKDLILQGSLLNGDAHVHKVESILNLKKEYDSPEMWSALRRDNWFWINSININMLNLKMNLLVFFVQTLLKDWN